ncbi:MAG: HAD-IA family hydrolase [Pseudomonadota bacterium]
MDAKTHERQNPMRPTIQTVLFDLDGTFADTAPDLAAALNRLRTELGLPSLALELLRPHTSQGVRGMLRAGFNLQPGEPVYRDFSERYLRYYSSAICVHTTLFPGIEALINELEARRIDWGIVTNKAQRFALPLLTQLGYAKRAACIVSGDSATHAKPSPQPMWLACALLACQAERTLYVGDDRRDIEAGQAAGMKTVAVRYGYLSEDPASTPIEHWGADYVVAHPDEIRALL